MRLEDWKEHDAVVAVKKKAETACLNMAGQLGFVKESHVEMPEDALPSHTSIPAPGLKQPEGNTSQTRAPMRLQVMAPSLWNKRSVPTGPADSETKSEVGLAKSEAPIPGKDPQPVPTPATRKAQAPAAIPQQPLSCPTPPSPAWPPPSMPAPTGAAEPISTSSSNCPTDSDAVSPLRRPPQTRDDLGDETAILVGQAADQGVTSIIRWLANKNVKLIRMRLPKVAIHAEQFMDRQSRYPKTQDDEDDGSWEVGAGL